MYFSVRSRLFYGLWHGCLPTTIKHATQSVNFKVCAMNKTNVIITKLLSTNTIPIGGNLSKAEFLENVFPIYRGCGTIFSKIHQICGKSLSLVSFFATDSTMRPRNGSVASDSSSDDTTADITVIGVPLNKGQGKVGTDAGPNLLRHAGITDGLVELGWTVKDIGDIKFETIEKDPPIKNLKNPRSVASASVKIKDTVAKHLRKVDTCMVLGGDHSMAIGSLMGHAEVDPDLCVLWVDAHADINTPLTSPSGNIHGMPLAFVTHELRPYLPNIPGFENIKPCLSVKNLAYIGLRDVDPGERYLIEKLGIAAFSMRDVDKEGINRVVEKAMKAIDPNGDKSIHLSFDVDSLDPAITPSTGTPVAGGLSIREGCYIAEELASTGRLSVIEVAEVNAHLGTDSDLQATLSNTVSVIRRCFHKRGGHVPKNYIMPRPEHFE